METVVWLGNMLAGIEIAVAFMFHSVTSTREGRKSDMSTELVGPIRRSYGAGCMLKPHLDKYYPQGEGYRPSHRCGNILADEGGYPRIPACLCPCHGLQMNEDEAKFYDQWIDREIIT